MQQNTLKRIFYLDFVRAIATLSIVLIHYNALFLYLPNPMPERCILSHQIFNIYLGAWGVSLFFIISGAALMHVYKSDFSTIVFYKKRFMAIYPMWWMTYLGGFSYYFLKYKTYNPNGVPDGEGWKILLSILGFDQYFASVTTTFSIVGEWFLGCIILMYIIFPVLRKIVLSPKLCRNVFPFFLFLYIVSIYNNINPLPVTNRLFARLPEFLFGMLFIQYWNENKFAKISVAAGGGILILNTLLRPHINSNLQTTYIGIASFICLVFLARNVEKLEFIQIAVSKICKYSYAVYLVHHIIILQIANSFDLVNITKAQNYVLFFVICEVIIVLSMLLYWIERIVMKWGSK